MEMTNICVTNDLLRIQGGIRFGYLIWSENVPQSTTEGLIFGSGEVEGCSKL